MAYRDLNAFIQKLEDTGELARITTRVSPILEITEITDRVSKRYGKALLFENVEGSRYPVLMNALGTYERMSMALGAGSLDAIGKQVEEYLDFRHYSSIPELFRFAPKLLRLALSFPIKKRLRLKTPPCQQVIDREPDLSTLPVLKCWPLDGGRFFTLPLVFTKQPDSGLQNVGMYRMQVLDSRTTAMHWHKHKDGSAIYEAWRKRGGRMPVAVALGSEPAITYAATAPLPPGLDELLLAGFLRRRPVALVKCVTCDLFVPQDAQFILEGYVDTEEPLALEGPFGDHTGYYSLKDNYPKFHVTCITHRENAIYPATVVGKPPMEDCYMAKATERIFLPLLKRMIPGLVNLDLPLSGVFHNCAILSVSSRFPGAGRAAMHAVWGTGQMLYTKLIVVVDEKIDPRDYEAVMNTVLANVDPAADLVLSQGPLDALDHASDRAFFGTRLGIDATHAKENDGKQNNFTVISVQKSAPFDGLRAAKSALADQNIKLAIAVDENVDTENRSEVFWRLFNNIDASRDLAVVGGQVAIDATKKWPQEGLTRPWPEDIVMSPEIKERVSRRWQEYGL